MSDFDVLTKTAGLNRTQKKFCKVPYNKNVRLLAPAGSGKTFSLLWRCKYIVQVCKEKELPAPHFLLVAFTRAAKMELETRLESDIFSDIHATVRTLNAWGWEQIKKPGKELVITRRDKASIINHDLLSVCQKYSMIAALLKTAYGRANNAAALMELIDTYKSLGFTHTMTKKAYKAHVRFLKEVGLMPYLLNTYEKLFQMVGIQDASKEEKDKVCMEFFDFWKKAVIGMEANNRYTLEDQKYWARIYLENQINVGKLPQGVARYSHIMVDEFQDINPLDIALLQTACRYHGQEKNKVALTIIGDDDQAIFGWRGTSPQFILHPEKFFGVSFETSVLDTNYRSPKNIVEISSKLLSYNKDREPKEMKSAAKGIAVIKIESKKKMLSTIDATMKLLDTLVEKKGCASVALIGRRQVSLFPYQVLLSAKGTPYHVDADLDIFEGDAMQALQNMLQIVYRSKNDDVDNPADALMTICDRIDRYKLQKKDRDAIIKYLERHGAETMQETLESLREYELPIKNLSAEQVYGIIAALLSSKTVYDFMKYIGERFRGLDKDYNKKDTDTHYKEPQFFRLAEISRRYGDDFRLFYRDIEKARRAGERSRSRNNDDSREGYEETNEIAIHLVTATRSKGHEYDAVIVLDVNDGEWPSHLAELREDIEEERRLFYVALSRARKHLYFVTSGDRAESRFLLEAGLM